VYFRIHQFNYRRLANPMPAIPMPSSASTDGSGMEVVMKPSVLSNIGFPAHAPPVVTQGVRVSALVRDMTFIDSVRDESRSPEGATKLV